MNKIHYHFSSYYFSLATIFICLFSNFYMLFNAFSVINIFFNNVSWELSDIQVGFEKGRETRDQIAKIHCIIEKAGEFQKNMYFCFMDYAKAFDYINHNKLWNILNKMGISDHLTCLLKNLYAEQEATVRTGHRTTDWFLVGKGVLRGCILSLYLFNLYAEYIMWNAMLHEAQAGIKISRRNINNLRYADDNYFNGRTWRGSKEPLDLSERGEWKSWLKTQYSKNEDQSICFYHCTASSWGKCGNIVSFHFLELQNQCRWWLQPQN